MRIGCCKTLDLWGKKECMTGFNCAEMVYSIVGLITVVCHCHRNKKIAEIHVFLLFCFDSLPLQ
jgi:hypothetical protein